MAEGSHGTNINLAIFVGIIIFGVVAGVMVAVTVTVKVVDVFVMVLFAAFITVVPYIASVRFYSPMVVDENGRVWSTFDNSYEIIHDEMLGGYFAVIYAGGYNSDRKFLSANDITPQKSTTLLVCAARALESLANGRYLVVHGALEELSPDESDEFIKRESVQAAVDGRVKRATVHFAFASKTLHPDAFDEAGVDLQAILDSYQFAAGEVRDTVARQIDESARKVRFIKDIKGAGQQDAERKLLEAMAARKAPPAEEESKQ